jgi:hypothetical protein
MIRIPALFAMAAAVTVVPVATADPATDTSCTPNLAGLSSQQQGGSAPVRCETDQWVPIPQPADPIDRWVSFGPALTLHGQAMANPNMLAGSWTATPIGPFARCRSVQQAVVVAGMLSPPQVDQGPPNLPMTFDIVPNAFTIHLSGYCTWVRNP